jgi:hypothetical protein
MMIPDALGPIELILRYASAIAMTVAALYVVCNLVWARTLTPRPVWFYVGVVITFNAIWRWVVLLILYDDQIDEYDLSLLTPWISPITESLAFLLAFAIIILVFTHIKARREHYRDWHIDD